MPIRASTSGEVSLSDHRLRCFAILPIQHSFGKLVNIASGAVNRTGTHEKRIILDRNIHEAIWRKVVILCATLDDVVAFDQRNSTVSEHQQVAPARA